MIIKDVICAAGRTGFFFDDQQAIKAGLAHDGFIYQGEPVTPGFRSVRQAGESVSVMLVLEDGQVAAGDCAAVQYSGAGGRDPLFLADEFIPVIEKEITPVLVNRDAADFRTLAEEIDRLEIHGKRLHTAIRYGVSIALLNAAAAAGNTLPCRVIADAYGLELVPEPVKIFSQSGDDRYDNVDKMILKHADVMPHALINNVDEKLGRDGGKLVEYVAWLRDRVMKLRPSGTYAPDFHIDVYGTIGLAFDNDRERIASYLADIEKAAAPFTVRIEGPVDLGGRTAQIDYMAGLISLLREKGVNVGMVADEWCNTLEDTKLFVDHGAADVVQIKTPDLGGITNSIEAVRYCKEHGVGGYLGGTCNETDVTARACVHAALATRPLQMLAKPGMGVDEGYMIVYNEMQRALSLLKTILTPLKPPQGGGSL